MNIRHLFLSTLNILIFFLIFYQIFKINYIFREDIVFGSQLFSTDLVKSQLFSTVMDVTDAFSAFAKFTIIIMISVFVVAWFNMVMNKYKNICSGLSKQQVFIIILGISFLLKLILLGFTIHPHDDVKDMVDGYKIMMKVLGSEPFSKYISEHTQRPIDINNDADIEQAMRETADTVYHPVGTCKMGNDEMSVVDSKLKVLKMSGLRVVDASIMPTIVGGNTNAPTIMIGEKASDMILEDWNIH